MVAGGVEGSEGARATGDVRAGSEFKQQVDDLRPVADGSPEESRAVSLVVLCVKCQFTARVKDGRSDIA